VDSFEAVRPGCWGPMWRLWWTGVYGRVQPGLSYPDRRPPRRRRHPVGPRTGQRTAPSTTPRPPRRPSWSSAPTASTWSWPASARSPQRSPCGSGTSGPRTLRCRPIRSTSGHAQSATARMAGTSPSPEPARAVRRARQARANSSSRGAVDPPYEPDHLSITRGIRGCHPTVIRPRTLRHRTARG
jgi:hypothetical protein